MKKVLMCIKKIVKLLGILAIIFLFLILFIHRSALKKEKNITKGAYGQLVTVDGGKICVDIEGSGDEVIVISPGYGSVSPVLEMKGIVEELKEKYTVVTIEPLGYGLSTKTQKPRTIENITEEMHQALSQLGYTRYIMMGHSIAGVYGLYYANQYPNEVKAYVGIDSSVPKQILEESTEESVVGYQLLSWLNQLGIYRFLAQYDQEGVIPKIQGYSYSEKERKVYEALTYENLLNKNMLEEFKCSNENFKKAIPLKFPKDVPVLYFLSTQNCELTPNWEVLHKEVITKETEGQIIILEGSHYLKYSYGKDMAMKLEKWKKENNI